MHVLIADDESDVLDGLARLVRGKGHRVSLARTGAETLRAARDERPDACLLDVHMPGGSGLDVLPAIVELEDSPSVVVITGEADVSMAVAAMKGGASDFLEKPVRAGVLMAVLDRIARSRTMLRERDHLRGELARLRSGPIVGTSPALRRVLDQVRRVAATPRTTVLVTGESGVGKELVARAIHEQSARASAPFIGLGCASLPEPIFEAELFGYEPGAFSGGSPGGRQGLFAAAEGGTLFLDEVGELTPTSQGKLLRVLQERVYRRVGSDEDRTTDVRIVASTNRDLGRLVDEGVFREDLFYRLNVLSIRVPPLRERVKDVAPLAAHFLSEFAAEFGKSFAGLAPAALQRLESSAWPGNVRELRNAIERATLTAPGGLIEPEHLGLGGPAGGPDAVDPHGEGALPLGDRSIRAVEEALIRRVLDETGGNRSRSAQILGINRSTLYSKLRSYGIGEG